MHILILGNGFDLAHDLKTSYKDFLDYCYKCVMSMSSEIDEKYKFGCERNLWLKHFITKNNSLGNNWIDLENEIYEVIKKLSKTYLIKNKYKHVQRIFVSFYVSNFSFDNLGKYVHSTEDESEFASYEYKEFYKNQCIEVYINSPNGLADFLFQQLREFTKLFECYLRERVLSQLTTQSNYYLSLKTIGVTKNSPNVFVLSFNYTNTCERIYNSKFKEYCSLNIKPVYVHGKVCDEEICNLVFGTKTFDEKEDIPLCFNIFQKHNQRHVLGTIDAYQDLLEKLSNVNIKPIFHIVGHSLDETDKNILKHVLKMNKRAKIRIYYHKPEVQDRLINNITKIIGEEDTMTKVRLIQQHNLQTGILIPIK